jgi:O-glycosyl hydrolase
MKPLEVISFKIDLSQIYQKIDGFGVNINSKYWCGGALKPIVDLLIDDLGAVLFRVDVYGKSNWIDPDGSLGPSSLNQEHYQRIYRNRVFEDGWGMMRYLNERGIAPYIAASGIVPLWMTNDGKTLTRYDYFAEMMYSFVSWAKYKAGIKFTLFGPLNETDIGPPEGPKVEPKEFAEVIKALDERFRGGLEDVKFVLPEQAYFNTDYVRYIINDPVLAKRIAVISMHMYSNIPVEVLRKFVDTVRGSLCGDRSIWMGEYGDLDQSGEMEWYVAWISTYRLFNMLEAGFNGAIFWDAYDNYHDHDEAWTIYGLLRVGRRIFTPKKRYYAAKQVYRFVRPGFVRVDANVESDKVRILAFTDDKREELSIIGMNLSHEPLYLNGFLEGEYSGIENKKLSYYRTTEEENCVKVGELNLKTENYPYNGIFFQAPPKSIFTITTVK